MTQDLTEEERVACARAWETVPKECGVHESDLKQAAGKSLWVDSKGKEKVFEKKAQGGENNGGAGESGA